MRRNRNVEALSRRKATEKRHASHPACKQPLSARRRDDRGPNWIPASAGSERRWRTRSSLGRLGGRRLSEAIERRGYDVGEAGGRRQARELGRVEPARLVEFLVEDRLARAPAGGKAQDDEMPLDPALRIADDGFAKAGERNRFDCQSCLLVHLARHGLRECL